VPLPVVPSTATSLSVQTLLPPLNNTTKLLPRTEKPVNNNNTTITMPFTASDICKIIIAIILPPLGVFLERGCGADFLINILLTILGYIPGIIHALYIIFKF
jgi:uncharacterized membrane protein YqaE (UPF0057 family)